jgi:hypothetical protein
VETGLAPQVYFWVPTLSLIAEEGILASEAAGQVVKQVLRIFGLVFWSGPFRKTEF